MNKIILLSLLSIVISFHSVYAQPSAEDIKDNWMGKLWKVVQYETAGMSENPSIEQTYDKIIIYHNATFIIVENGKVYKGSWTMQGSSFTCRADGEDSAWRKTYTVVSTNDRKSTMESQDMGSPKKLYYLEQE
jgi:hypothetical protein